MEPSERADRTPYWLLGAVAGAILGWIFLEIIGVFAFGFMGAIFGANVGRYYRSQETEKPVSDDELEARIEAHLLRPSPRDPGN